MGLKRSSLCRMRTRVGGLAERGRWVACRLHSHRRRAGRSGAIGRAYFFPAALGSPGLFFSPPGCRLGLTR